MALVKITQPQLNVLRGLLTQDGYAKDFGDFYDAGKALSEWPKDRYLGKDASEKDLLSLFAISHEIEISDKAKGVIRKALGHYIASKKAPTEQHFELMQLLNIDSV